MMLFTLYLWRHTPNTYLKTKLSNNKLIFNLSKPASSLEFLNYISLFPEVDASDKHNLLSCDSFKLYT